MKVILYTDGAARGNPGPAGAGVLLQDATGNELWQGSEYLGYTTNNVAEYQALLSGLQQARRLGATAVEVRTDSELLAKQLNGHYRVKSPHLLPLFQQVVQLKKEFASFSIRHIPREENRQADRLANAGIDLASTNR